MYRKFKNKKIDTPEGKFDSKLEYEYWLQLKAREQAGEITNLQRQVPFELIPKQTEWVEKQLKTKTKMVEVFREHPVVISLTLFIGKTECGLSQTQRGQERVIILSNVN